MRSTIHKRGPVSPEMNITPLIDVVFLLIVFFMLVNNLIAEEQVPMIVPALEQGAASPVGEEERLVVSIAPDAEVPAARLDHPLLTSGRVAYVQVGSMQRFTLADLAGVTAAIRDRRAAQPGVEVQIRADASLFYSAVEPVMRAVTEAGVSKVSLVVSSPTDEAQAE